MGGLDPRNKSGSTASGEGPGPVHFVARVGEYSERFGSRPLITWVNAKGEPEHAYTYAEFDHAARGLAAWLFEQGLKRGDTAILAYTPCVDFYVALWACMISGIVAVPVNPP